MRGISWTEDSDGKRNEDVHHFTFSFPFHVVPNPISLLLAYNSIHGNVGDR